jgi:Protein of unknown function (DUF2711)
MTVIPFDPEMGFPPDDQKFLDHAGGRFQAGILLLHPFFKLNGRRPFRDGDITSIYAELPTSVAAYQVAVEKKVDISNLYQAIDNHGYQVIDNRGGKSVLLLSMEKVEWEALPEDEGPQIISWNDVVQLTGLESVGHLNQALLTLIGALHVNFRDEAAARKVVSFAEENDVFLPIEDEFQKPLEPIILSWLDKLGVQDLIFQPEFDKDSDPPVIFQLAEGFPDRGRGGCYTHDKRLLLTLGFDCYFTLVLGSAEEIQLLVKMVDPDVVLIHKDMNSAWWKTKN